MNESSKSPRKSRLGDRLLQIAEDVVYVGIAVALTITALVLLGLAAGELIKLVLERSQAPAIAVLDTLLLVFIVVELLFAVRTTLARRELVAEPFLLAGIIASIKEIVVLSVKVAEDAGRGQPVHRPAAGGGRARRPCARPRRHSLAAAAQGARTRGG